MLSVGLTGGIGCGKSAVADHFAALGVAVIDADRIARQIVVPGSAALQAISDDFGADILLADGSLDRKTLRQRIFQDEAARQRLNNLLHPQIRRHMVEERAQLDTPYCLLVMPLLIESGMQDLVDRILVVDCDPSMQIERVCQRDAVAPTQVSTIMSHQVTREQRLQQADDVIHNTLTLSDLAPQVEALHQQYLSLAKDSA